jgi:septum formation protein
MLTRLGIAIAVVPSDCDESLLANESPEAHVVRLSIAKAQAVAQRSGVPGRWFIGSDTVVVRDVEILGKPADAADAARMLRSLSGRSHRVVSGYAVLDRQTGARIDGAITTAVTFRQLTDGEIARYIASGEPADKAGAYAIQGLGAALIERINGSYTSVVGLPLCEVVAALETFGAVTLFADVPIEN